jgi:hypothetical protein
MEQLAGIERGVAIPILTNAAGGILVGQVRGDRKVLKPNQYYYYYYKTNG